jgi:phospholipid/cholesterol/gamma-HCH transport system substrate-binding protein
LNIEIQYQQVKIHKETKVAIFVIIAGVMLYTGFNFLKGIDFFSKTRRYYINYTNVSGLTASNAVIVNGFSVGRIKSITINNDKDHTLKVAIDIDKTITIGDSSKAIITSTDILGSKALVILLGNINKPLPEESFLIGEVEKGFTDRLSEKAMPMVASVSNSIERINQLMSDKNIQSIALSLENMEKTTATLNDMLLSNKSNIQGTTLNLRKLTASLVESEKQLNPLLIKANIFADSLNKMQLASTVYNTNKTIKEINKILEDINNAKGSLGKLIKDDSLYVNLNHTARDLDKLLIDLKARPKRYVHFSVFGKKDK